MKPSRRPQVLIIEDDLGYGRDFVDAFTRAGWTVTWWTEPRAEVAAAVAEVQPDVIHLDVNLPGLSGFDVAALLRQDVRTAAIPFYFVTSMSGADSRRRAAALGAAAYVVKQDISARDIVAAAARLLRREPS